MKKCIVVAFVCFIALTTNAEIKLPKLISNGVVLQRGEPIKIWGWGSVGEKVTVKFCGATVTTETTENGKWIVVLPAQKEGGPFEMEITGSNKIVVNDILIGDVWVCSGQSNMTLNMSRVKDLYKKEIEDCENNSIRQFLVAQNYDFNIVQEDVAGGTWQPANSNTIMNFVAVGYFFAKNLYEKYHVPIGLINSAIGGTPIESWVSEETVKDYPNLYANLLKHKNQNYIDSIRNKEKKLNDDWYSTLLKNDLGNSPTGKKWSDPTIDVSSWKVMNVPGFWDEGELGRMNGVVWFRKEVDVPKSMVDVPARLDLGTIVDSDSTFVNGKFVGNITYQYPPRKYELAPGILKEGKNVIVVRIVSSLGRGGFTKDKSYQLFTANHKIDLQGEWKYKLGASAGPLRPQTFFYYAPTGLYNGMIAPLFNTAIKGVLWYQGEANTSRAKEYQKLLPALINNWREKWNQGNFPFLFVQLPNYMAAKKEPSESQWAELREAQLKTLSVPNTGMAVTIDIGEWNDIHPLRKKEVGERLALAAENIAYNEKGVVGSSPIYKSSKIDGNKIVITFDGVGSGLISNDGKPLRNFAIAGADKKFVWANAIIEGNKVIVSSDEIQNPVAVRYAWADNPADVNFYNKEGLPASPFRTDE